MQDKSNINNPIVNILIQPRFSILRHLVLMSFILFISAGFIWHIQESGAIMSPTLKYGGLLFYFSVFLAGSYFNIYILTPHLLFKNKWMLYFCCLLGVVALVISSVILFQMFFFEKDVTQSLEPDKITGIFIGIVNILSSFLSISLLFVGTTTIVLFSHWIQNMQQADELQTETLQSELKLLKSQINPHFLFNMLNNANIMIDEDPEMASDILIKLEDLLHYQINDSAQDKVYLSDDIRFLSDYLELEKIRRDHFEYSIVKEGEMYNIQIPPLLFITFVENAVKHNSDSLKLSYVNLYFKVENNKLQFICENSVPQNPIIKKEGGIGLSNIRRRLDLLYKDNYELRLDKEENKYTVHLELDI